MGDSDADDAFRALANGHRRRLLVALLERNPQEEMVLPDDVPLGSPEAEEVHTELYHTHLPMLERHGFVEWNHERKTVSKGPTFDQIRPLLELIERHRDGLPDGWV